MSGVEVQAVARARCTPPPRGAVCGPPPFAPLGSRRHQSVCHLLTRALEGIHAPPVCRLRQTPPPWHWPSRAPRRAAPSAGTRPRPWRHQEGSWALPALTHRPAPRASPWFRGAREWEGRPPASRNESVEHRFQGWVQVQRSVVSMMQLRALHAATRAASQPASRPLVSHPGLPCSTHLNCSP